MRPSQVEGSFTKLSKLRFFDGKESAIDFRIFAEAGSFRFGVSSETSCLATEWCSCYLPDVQMSASMTRKCVFLVPNVGMGVSAPLHDAVVDRSADEQAHYPTRDKLQKRVLAGFQIPNKTSNFHST